MMQGVHGPTSSMFTGNEINIYDGNFNQTLHIGRRQGFDLLTDMTSPSAFYNAGHTFDLPKCHPNTRVAILERLKNWLVGNVEPNASILWLNGAAGSGKSCIARSVAEWCQEQNLLLASFFFFRSDSSRNSVKHFIPTLAYNIIQTVPGARPIIDYALRSDPHIFAKTIDIQMLHLVFEPLARPAPHMFSGASNFQATQFTPEIHSSSVSSLPYVFIVDGLDECLDQAEQKAIIRLFASVLERNIGWKILIASRSEQAIRSLFDAFVPRDLSSRIALSNEYDSDEDIRRFLNDKFAEIKTTHFRKAFFPVEWPSPFHIDQLVRKSSAQFIYAATVIRYVSSDYESPVDRLRSVLDNGRIPISKSGISDSRDLPFTELDTLYAQILQTASERLRVDNLKTVPLVAALSILLGTHNDFLDEFHESPADAFSKVLRLDIDIVSLILAELSSILSIQRSCIVVYHASLEDYLFDRSRSGFFWVDECQVWTDLFFYWLSATELHFPLRAVTYWRKLTRFMERGYMADVSEHLSSYDILPVLEAYCPGEIQGFRFMEVTTFLTYLRKTSLDNPNKDLAQSYHRFMSTFDDWLARKLDKFSQKTSTHQAYVAFLCSQTTFELCLFGLHAQRDSSHIEQDFVPIKYSAWFNLLQNAGSRLPKVRGCIFDNKMQTSGVWLSVHFLVQNAIADGIMRFRRKSFPWWMSRRRMCSRCVRCSGGNGSTQHWCLPFVEKVDVKWHLTSSLGRTMAEEIMSHVLPGLIVLLHRSPPSPRIVFALRMAASLVCVQRRYHSIWRQLRKTIRRYLVDVACLKERRGSGLGFVEVSNTYRFHGCNKSGSTARCHRSRLSLAIRPSPPSFQ